MSGVHASCVEDWIRHHRASGVSDVAPKCSVCNQTYCGVESRPGVIGFVQHLAKDFLEQLARCAGLVALLVAYWAAAQPDLFSVFIRTVLFIISACFFSFKTLVLVASLPRGRLPPQNLLRHFFVADFQNVARHLAESVAIVCIAVLWVACDQLHYYYLIPVCFIVLVPLFNAMFCQHGSPCSSRFLFIALFLLWSPVLVFLHVAKSVYHEPRRLLDPCDGVMHLAVPITAVALCWLCYTSTPMLVMWAVHSLLLLGLACELLTRRRLPWKEGRIWWLYLQLSMLATYVANLLPTYTHGITIIDHSLLIALASLVWVGLSTTVSVAVNWDLCVEQFRAWQSRNGSFQLSTAASVQVPAGGPSGVEAGSNAVQAQSIGAPASAVGVLPTNGNRAEVV
eukprot:TRINITY_DN18334_c0_g1_i1.p1 TRINITY_DN18334_c0_g1~~TRINITY_DN18334_c0_g1_i1.p1  ORF type:complete len:449 (-),score=60.06 TRINITY_DN18334_c0_g1_i1:169-1356(-)